MTVLVHADETDAGKFDAWGRPTEFFAAAIDPAAINEETAAAVSAEITGKFGPELEVAPLPAGEWQPKDPIEELLDMQTKDPE